MMRIAWLIQQLIAKKTVFQGGDVVNNHEESNKQIIDIHLGSPKNLFYQRISSWRNRPLTTSPVRGFARQTGAN